MNPELQSYAWIAAASLLVWLLSLTGLLLLKLPQPALERWLPRLLSLAIGVLLGDAFLHLLPHAIAHSERLVHDHGTRIFAGVLGGMLLFHLLEQLLHWHGEHRLPGKGEPPTKNLAAHTGPGLLAADAVHGMVDGILIAASFLYSVETGLLTAMAITVHEVVQETTKFAILLQTGWSRLQAVLLNLACGITVVIGALLAILLVRWTVANLGLLLAITAGGFIYVAASDLIPLARERLGAGHSRRWQIGCIAAGVALMQALTALEAH